MDLNERDLASETAAMRCKCGVEMVQENLSVLPADYHWYWVCPLMRWFNFWKHTKATEVKPQ